MHYTHTFSWFTNQNYCNLSQNLMATVYIFLFVFHQRWLMHLSTFTWLRCSKAHSKNLSISGKSVNYINLNQILLYKHLHCSLFKYAVSPRLLLSRACSRDYLTKVKLLFLYIPCARKQRLIDRTTYLQNICIHIFIQIYDSNYMLMSLQLHI